MPETLKDAVRSYGRRHGLTEREAEQVILGAGLAALESDHDPTNALVRTMRLGMTVALNLVQEDRDRIIDRAWAVANDCDQRVGILTPPVLTSPRPAGIASVVDLKTRTAR